ncbi:MAG TPA: hypothetical protein VGI48_00260 [Caldimonas sp.]
MLRPMKTLAFASALALSACVIATHGTEPQAVENQADTYRFRIFANAFVMEGTVADHAADEEIVKFRAANGYASSRIVSRDHRDSAFVYTVVFAR